MAPATAAQRSEPIQEVRFWIPVDKQTRPILDVGDRFEPRVRQFRGRGGGRAEIPVTVTMPGALLFRERAYTQLTEFGRQMRPRLEAILDAAETAVGLAAMRRAEPCHTVRIGSARASVLSLLPTC